MNSPIRVLELRSVRGTGGGPEKTILRGAARADRSRFAVTVCYIRDSRDDVFNIGSHAAGLDVDYVAIVERHSFDPAIWAALRRLAVTRGIQIVHAHDYKTDALAYLLARATGITPLATAHGWTGHSRRERLVYYPADKRLLASFPRCIAVSNEIRSELCRSGVGASRISTILNGIDHLMWRRDRLRVRDARVEFGIASKQIAIGAVGRLEPQKRFDVLLRAFAMVARERKDVRLIVAGDGSSRAQLETMAVDLGVADACRFVGHCSDVTGFQHAMNVFVQSSDYEGTSNALLEAMALETPVVATDVGGTRELMHDGVHGLLVPRQDPVALARALQYAIDDTAATARRAAAARQRVEHELSFDTRMAALEAIYEELAARDADHRQGRTQCA